MKRFYIFVLLFSLVFSSSFAQPQFSSSFDLNSIGPGSISVLTYTITNNSGTGITDLAFKNKLPVGVFVASPANIQYSPIDAFIKATPGGDSIIYSGGKLAPNSSLTIKVNVTSIIVGTHINLTDDLTSSGGNSGTTTTNLVVSANQPGLKAIFNNNTVLVGQKSILTYTLDNTLRGSAYGDFFQAFQLPNNLKLSYPLNLSTSCTYTPFPSFTVISGTVGESSFQAQFLYADAGETCTISAEVESALPGTYLVKESFSYNNINTGIASAELIVENNITNNILFTKDFTNDPVSPGSTVSLNFNIENKDRKDALTAVTFTDNLEGVLAGLAPTGLPLSNVCGNGSTLSFNGGILTLSGGQVPAEGSCNFTVNLTVPGTATGGGFLNETSEITGMRNGGAVTGPKAKSTLIVEFQPTLTKIIVKNPVEPDSTTIFRYTITNTDPSNPISNLKFFDNLHAFGLNTSDITGPANGFCGGGVFSPKIVGDGPTYSLAGIDIINASLVAGGSCTFDVSVKIPSGTAGGTYSGILNEFSGVINGLTIAGKATNQDLLVAKFPQWKKSFLKGSGNPGDTLILQYEMWLDPTAVNSFQNISFTDDFNAIVPGLAMIETPQIEMCNSGAMIAGTTILDFSNGQLNAGDTCRFTIKLKIPATAKFGNYTSTSSVLSGNYGANTFNAPIVESNFSVLGLKIVKEYVGEPFYPGGQAQIKYTLSNLNANVGLREIFVNDKLANSPPGFQLTGLPQNDVCGAGSSINWVSGTMRLINGLIPANSSCSFTVTGNIPTNASQSSFASSIESVSFKDDPATKTGYFSNTELINPPLLVSSPIGFSKSFSKTSIQAGESVDLTFTINNLSPMKVINSLTFTDDLSAMLNGTVAVGLPQSNICGTGSTISGTSLLTFSGGSIPAGGNCSFTITLNTPSDYYTDKVTNTTSKVTGNMEGLAVESLTASAALNIVNNRRPLFSKSFALDNIKTGEITTLTLTIDNSANSVAVNSLAFTDAFPEGMFVAPVPNLSTTCIGGTLTGIPGSGSLNYTGGSIAANSICTIAVDVKVGISGNVKNTSGELTSNVGSSGAAIDSIQVVLPSPLSFTSNTSAFNTIDLAAQANANNADSVLILFNTIDAFGVPMGNLMLGDILPGGGNVLFKGLAANIPNHTGLSQSTKYFYKAYSLGYNLYSSTALSGNATTCINPSQSFNIVASNAINCIGNNLKLTVDPILENISFVWQVKASGGGSFVNISTGGIYAKHDSSTLLITGLTTAEDGNKYRCIFVTSCINDTTAEYSLNVYGNPIILTQPKDSSACEGSDFKFITKASGPGIAYQWQKDINGSGFHDIIGQTNDTLSLNNVLFADDSTSYRCVITGTCGVSISDTALLRAPKQPTLLAGTATNPSTCLGVDGNIPFTTTNLPNGIYSLSYSGAGSPKNVTVSLNSFNLTNLGSGSYSNFSITYLGCLGIDAGTKTLTDPPTPTILAGLTINPSTCLGVDGSIPFTSSNLPDGTYSLSYTGAGSPKNVTVSSNAFNLTDLASGSFSNFSITYLACAATDASTKTLTDPPTPTIIAGTAIGPSTCLGVDGSIPFTTTNLPDGTYALSYTGAGTPQNVTISSNAFSLTGLASGSYSNFSITYLACVATDAGTKTLSDPPTPTILAGDITNPSICEGLDGSIAFTSTNLSNGVYSLSFTGMGSPKNVTVNANTFSLSGLGSGIYSNFSLTNVGCTAVDPSGKELLEPTFEAAASNTGPYEEGSLIHLTASEGFGFQWAGPNGFSSSLQNPSIPDAKVANAGVYTVTISGQYACTLTATTQVNVSCSTPSMNYYLAYAGAVPELITPLANNIEVQQSNRLMTVVAVTTCTSPVIESVKLQLSGTTNLQYYVDSNMPFNLHEVGNVSNGDRLVNNLYTFIARGYDQNEAMGNVLVGPDEVQFKIVIGDRMIQAPTLSSPSVCAGTSITVSAVSVRDYNAGNLYQAYLSNSNGEFSKPILVGSSSDPNNIVCQIPNYLSSGNNYKVMVISTAPVVSSPPSIVNLSIVGADLSLVSSQDDVAVGINNQNAINNIVAVNSIDGTANVTYQAGRKIELNPGFNSDAGTVFRAEIKNICNN